MPWCVSGVSTFCQVARVTEAQHGTYAVMTQRWTPYNDAYPSCALCFVQLLIHGGDSYTPEEISALLDLQPDRTVRKGDVFQSFTGKTRVETINFWKLSTRRRVDSYDLRRHLDYVLALLEPRKDALARLQKRDDTLLYVRALHAAWGGGPVLWPRQMAGLAALDLELGFECAEMEEGGDPEDYSPE